MGLGPVNSHSSNQCLNRKGSMGHQSLPVSSVGCCSGEGCMDKSHVMAIGKGATECSVGCFIYKYKCSLNWLWTCELSPLNLPSQVDQQQYLMSYEQSLQQNDGRTASYSNYTNSMARLVMILLTGVILLLGIFDVCRKFGEDIDSSSVWFPVLSSQLWVPEKGKAESNVLLPAT